LGRKSVFGAKGVISSLLHGDPLWLDGSQG
jgi:hypothetical protein